MLISVLGTGRMGKGLVKLLSPHIPDLLWGSRFAEKADSMVEQYRLERVRPVNSEEAMKADIIIHSLWFKDVIPWAKENARRLAGKIVVDIANPFNGDFSDFTTEWATSAAEELQRAVPQTIIVGAFKNTFFQVLEEPVHQGITSDIYVTGDDAKAKRIVMELLNAIPFRILDGGGLANNRTIERMTLFEREVSIRYGNYPHVSFRMFGINK